MNARPEGEAVGAHTASQALPGLDGWTREQSDAALAEGWDVFDCDGPENGRVQLCRDDEAAVFESDSDAWKHVLTRASVGDELHITALAFIGKHNPGEQYAIQQWSQPACTQDPAR